MIPKDSLHIWFWVQHYSKQINSKVDRSGEQCQVVPRRVAKDSSWKDDIYMSCVTALNTGSVPEVVYPIDEALEKEKEEERIRKFDKVSVHSMFFICTTQLFMFISHSHQLFVLCMHCMVVCQCQC